MNRKSRRLTVARPRVDNPLGSASREALAQCTFRAVLRIILVLLALVSSAQEATAQEQAFVVNARSNTVSVINRTTNQVMTNIAVGSVPVDIAVNPNMARAYVANSGSNTVSVIDTTSFTVVATIPVGLSPVSVAVDIDGRHAYVANSRASSVSVIDTFTQTVVATVPVGPVPNKLTVASDGGTVWVTNAGDHSVSVINTGSYTVTATVPVGATPFNVIAPPQPPTCNDQRLDGYETDVDCGGPFCPKCAAGQRCSVNSDCTSNICNTTVSMGGPPPNTCQP